MRNQSLETYRKELEFLSSRFQSVRDGSRKRGMSDSHHILDRVSAVASTY